MSPRGLSADLAYRLIVHAAIRAPAPLSERLREEWLADLHHRHGSLARLRLAAGCHWASFSITRDFQCAQLAASGAAGAPRALLGELASALLPRFSHRTVIFAVLASVQVGVGAIIYCYPTYHSDWKLIDVSLSMTGTSDVSAVGNKEDVTPRPAAKWTSHDGLP